MSEPRYAAASGAMGGRVDLTRTPSARSRFEAAIRAALIAVLVAVPLGLLCAVYLSEYAPRRVRKVVKPVLEVLAGVPTIVFGYFALTFFTPEVLKDALGLHVGVFNGLSAG